ncbi:MAG TPA: hypothetical protein V6D18_19650 [Thermosynechococcaceae cyanobacterium]
MAMLKKFGAIAAIAVLVILLFQSRTPAQSASNLQADIFALRSEVSQLRAQVSQLGGRGYSPRPVPSQSRTVAGERLTDSQVVDRLATLAIEAKDRLKSLEARVSKLEQR